MSPPTPPKNDTSSSHFTPCCRKYTYAHFYSPQVLHFWKHFQTTIYLAGELFPTKNGAPRKHNRWWALNHPPSQHDSATNSSSLLSRSLWHSKQKIIPVFFFVGNENDLAQSWWDERRDETTTATRARASQQEAKDHVFCLQSVLDSTPTAHCLYNGCSLFCHGWKCRYMGLWLL